MMDTIKIVDFTELQRKQQRGLQEFKRGMLGLLKLLMYEAMQSQRLDHYAMYKTMRDITEAWEVPDTSECSDGSLAIL